MGILSGSEIKKQIGLGNIWINPFHEQQVNPNSYNVRLGDILKVYEEAFLDVRHRPNEKIIKITDEGYRLSPGIGYLGTTVEMVGSTKYVPIINGRSTLGRYFLTVHQTAGFGDVGFYGHWTLEIVVMGQIPIWIYPGIEIAQICFEELVGEGEQQYHGRYAGQQLTTYPKGPEPL